MQQKIGEHFVMGSAMRRERYSDIGAVAAGNLVVRYDPVPALGLRASASSGFRAPSVHQRFYGSTVTDLNGSGVMSQTITVREGSAVARALAIEPLRPELSRTTGFAIVLRPAADFSLTANAWRTRIYHRIVLSSPIGPDAVHPVAAVLVPLGADQVQLFTNAIDTVTKGLDLVAEHTRRGNGRTLVLSAQLGFNRTTVAARYSTSPLVPGARLFDDTQVTLVERGQPRQHHAVKADLSMGPWGFGARANYYGAVQGQGYTSPAIQTWEPKWLLDLSLRRALGSRLSLSAGVNNLFDRYPGTPGAQMGLANCRETCPFGINGRTLYARVDYRF
jgi:iron complex outermembrane receptor protein